MGELEEEGWGSGEESDSSSDDELIVEDITVGEANEPDPRGSCRSPTAHSESDTGSDFYDSDSDSGSVEYCDPEWDPCEDADEVAIDLELEADFVDPRDAEVAIPVPPAQDEVRAAGSPLPPALTDVVKRRLDEDRLREERAKIEMEKRHEAELMAMRQEFESEAAALRGRAGEIPLETLSGPAPATMARVGGEGSDDGGRAEGEEEAKLREARNRLREQEEELFLAEQSHRAERAKRAQEVEAAEVALRAEREQEEREAEKSRKKREEECIERIRRRAERLKEQEAAEAARREALQLDTESKLNQRREERRRAREARDKEFTIEGLDQARMEAESLREKFKSMRQELREAEPSIGGQQQNPVHLPDPDVDKEVLVEEERDGGTAEEMFYEKEIPGGFTLPPVIFDPPVESPKASDSHRGDLPGPPGSFDGPIPKATGPAQPPTPLPPQPPSISSVAEGEADPPSDHREVYPGPTYGVRTAAPTTTPTPLQHPTSEGAMHEEIERRIRERREKLLAEMEASKENQGSSQKQSWEQELKEREQMRFDQSAPTPRSPKVPDAQPAQPAQPAQSVQPAPTPKKSQQPPEVPVEPGLNIRFPKPPTLSPPSNGPSCSPSSCSSEDPEREDDLDRVYRMAKGKGGKDYCSVLGIEEEDLFEADVQSRVKRAYRRACLLWHPDKWINSSKKVKDKAEFLFNFITDAQNCLLDSKSRDKWISTRPRSFLAKGSGANASRTRTCTSTSRGQPRESGGQSRVPTGYPRERASSRTRPSCPQPSSSRGYPARDGLGREGPSGRYRTASLDPDCHPRSSKTHQQGRRGSYTSQCGSDSEGEGSRTSRASHHGRERARRGSTEGEMHQGGSFRAAGVPQGRATGAGFAQYSRSPSRSRSRSSDREPEMFQSYPASYSSHSRAGDPYRPSTYRF